MITSRYVFESTAEGMTSLPVIQQSASVVTSHCMYMVSLKIKYYKLEFAISSASFIFW